MSIPHARHSDNSLPQRTRKHSPFSEDLLREAAEQRKRLLDYLSTYPPMFADDDRADEIIDTPQPEPTRKLKRATVKQGLTRQQQRQWQREQGRDYDPPGAYFLPDRRINKERLMIITALIRGNPEPFFSALARDCEIILDRNVFLYSIALWNSQKLDPIAGKAAREKLLRVGEALATVGSGALQQPTSEEERRLQDQHQNILDKRRARQRERAAYQLLRKNLASTLEKAPTPKRRTQLSRDYLTTELKSKDTARRNAARKLLVELKLFPR